MPIDIKPPHIKSKEPPREILVAAFKFLGEIPMAGRKIIRYGEVNNKPYTEMIG